MSADALIVANAYAIAGLGMSRLSCSAKPKVSLQAMFFFIELEVVTSKAELRAFIASLRRCFQPTQGAHALPVSFQPAA